MIKQEHYKTVKTTSYSALQKCYKNGLWNLAEWKKMLCLQISHSLQKRVTEYFRREL